MYLKTVAKTDFYLFKKTNYSQYLFTIDHEEATIHVIHNFYEHQNITEVSTY